MPIYDNELPLYDYKPTGIIDKLVLRNNNPLDAWFGDTKLTAKDMGDYYAYSDGSHQWTYPKSKLEDTSNLNAYQRLERDYADSPAYGIENLMANILTGGYSSVAQSADQSAKEGSYLSAISKYALPLLGPVAATNPWGLAATMGTGILGSNVVDKGMKLATGRNWADNISEWTGLTQEDATLTNPGMWYGGFWGNKLSKPVGNFIGSAYRNKGIGLVDGSNITWIPFNRSWKDGFSHLYMWPESEVPGNRINFIDSKYPGEGRKLYDTAIKERGNVITGESYLSAPKSYSTMQHYYPNRQVIGNYGMWDNSNMVMNNLRDFRYPKTLQEFEALAEQSKTDPNFNTYIELNNAPVYNLTEPYDNVATIRIPSILGHVKGYGGPLVEQANVFGDGGDEIKYYIKPNEVGYYAPEILVTPQGNRPGAILENGDYGVSAGFFKDLGVPIYEKSNRELNNNQYKTMPTNSEASNVADRHVEATEFKPWNIIPLPIEEAVDKIINLGRFTGSYLNAKSGGNKGGDVIDLTNSNVARITSNTDNVTSILANDFVEDNNNTIRRKRDFLNTTDTLLGDRKIPLSKIRTFYGIEDGKLKAGPLSVFKDDTYVMPNRAKYVGKIINYVGPRGATKEYKDSVEAGLEKYNEEHGYLPNFRNKFYASPIPFYSKPDQFSVLRNYKSYDEATAIQDSIGRKYKHLGAPTMGRVITEEGDTIADYRFNAAPKALFADEKGNAIFTFFPEEREEEINQFLRRTPMYPIMVDNGRYEFYQVKSPNVHAYSGLANPDDMYIIGTTRAYGGILSNTPLQEPLQPFNGGTLMELGNKHDDKRTKEQEIKGSLPPYFSYDRDKDEYISDYWSDEYDAPDWKWYRSKAAKELKKTHRQVIDQDGRIKYVPIDVYKAGSWKARGLPNPLYEELGRSSSIYANPFEGEIVTGDGKIATILEGEFDEDGNQKYVTEDGELYYDHDVDSFAEGGSLNTLKQWNDLSLKERAEMMRVAIRNGITNLSDIRDKYNEFALGGNIYDGVKMHTQQMNQQANPKNIYDMLPLLFAKDGVKIKVTSGYRPNAIVQESGKNTGRRSRHSIWGGAADIVAIDGSNFADIRRVLDDPNSNTSRWLIANGYGYLDETSATGTTKYWHDHNRDHSHYHIGKDYGNRYASLLKSAPAQIQQSGNNYIDIAKDHIRRNESFFAKSYADAPAGKNWRSVGYGFNDSGFWGKYPNGISKYYDARGGIIKEEAEKELDWMLRTQMIPTLEKVYGNRWSQFNDNQKAAIIDTMYQRPASVLRDSAFYNAIMANNPNAVDYLGVKSYDRRNADRRNLYTMNAMEVPNGGYSPEQQQMAYNPFIGYQVSNPKAFYGNPEDYQQDYAKLFSQQEVPQPLIDAAFKYSEEEQRKAERQRQMANFRTLLGMTGAFDDDGLLGGVPLLTGGLFGNTSAHGGRLYGDGGEKEKYVIQDSIVPDALFVQRPVYDNAIFVPNVSREDTLKRANRVYKNYSEAKDSPLSKEQEDTYNALRYLKDNVSSIIPAGVSNCTLTATQWINPRNPIKNASSIVNNPSMYGYEPILQEDAIPGDLLIAKTPNKDSYHTMLITGFADNDGEYSLDGSNFKYKKGEPLLTYSRGGHDASFIRTGVPLSVYNANSDGHTESLYYRYKYPNESFLPLVTVNGR